MKTLTSPTKVKPELKKKKFFEIRLNFAPEIATDPRITATVEEMVVSVRRIFFQQFPEYLEIINPIKDE